MSSPTPQSGAGSPATSIVRLPAATAWPITLAFGVALLFAGIVTSLSVFVLGAILAVVGCVGWFRDVFPHEKHVEVRVVAEPVTVTTSRPAVARLEIAPELHHRGNQRWPGRGGCHGGARVSLRPPEARKYLVSD